MTKTKENDGTQSDTVVFQVKARGATTKPEPIVAFIIEGDADEKY